jgi:hypothetical protein
MARSIPSVVVRDDSKSAGMAPGLGGALREAFIELALVWQGRHRVLKILPYVKIFMAE